MRPALVAALTCAALACGGRQSTDVSESRVARPAAIDVAPVMIAPTIAGLPPAYGMPQELPPIVCGPDAEDELPPPCEAMASHPTQMQFLEDVCRIKRFPADNERDHRCPVEASTAEMVLADGRVVDYRPATAGITVDDDLRGVVPPSIKIAVILVRRVNGVPHYRYVSNGTHEQPFQTWSASKFLAIANAASTLRERSHGAVGLDALVDQVPVGDLVTIVHTYDESRYTSNALSKWFHDVGGRAHLNDLVHAWLQRPAAETLGGNYGPGFVGLGLTFRKGSAAVSVTRDGPWMFDNHVSALTMAESLKRLVMHREDSSTRMPGLEWADLRVLFYGAESSKWFEGRPGGMSADKSVYLQLHDEDGLVRRSQGRFRVFSKSGMGNAQYVHAGYGCFPSLDDAGRAIVDEGREVFVSARVDGPGGYVENDRIMARTYKTVMRLVSEGRI